MRREGGLSEIVSSLSLIIVLVIAAGVILSFTTAQYPKETLPYADIIYEEIVIDPAITDNYAIFHHKGGDNFPPGSLRIRAYDRSGVFQEEYASDDLILVKPDGTETSWLSSNIPLSFGYGLKTPDFGGSDHSYQVVYKQGAGDYVYRQFGMGGTVIGLPSSPGPLPSCTLTPADPIFSIDSSHAPLYWLKAGSSADNIKHNWIINGSDFHKVLSGANVSILLPQSPYNREYQITHIVTQYESGYPVCSRSQPRIQPVIGTGCFDSCDTHFIYESSGTSVTFLDRTPGAVAWYWDFGDGSTPATVSNPVHIYSGASSFPVTLTVSKDICGIRTQCPPVMKRVTPGCSGDASFTANYVEPSVNPWNVTFSYHPNTYIRDGTYSLNWDFGDNNKKTIYQDDWEYSFSNQYTHSYYQCRDFSVTLTVNTPNCGSFSNTNTINIPCICLNPPNATFSVNKTRIGTPFEIEINDNSTNKSSNRILNWIWDMGDGNIFNNTTANPPTKFRHSYPNCSEYSIHLTTFDLAGCSDTAIEWVSCGGDTCTPGIPNASFVYSVNGREVQFTDKSKPEGNIRRWQWDMGDGTRYTTQNVTHPYSQYGNNTVKLRVWDQDGCFGDTIREVSLTCPKPEANFSIINDPVNPQKFSFIDNSVIPVGLTGEYHWDFGDGTSYIGKNPPEKTYVNCDHFTIRLKVITNCGSSDDIIKDAICGCPSPIPKFEYTCIGSQLVSFTDLSRAIGGGIKSWYWEFGDMRLDNISGLQNPYHEYDYPGTYPVNLTVFTTCNSSARWTRYVTVPCCQMPTPDFTFTCKPDGRTINFKDMTKTTGDTITEYLWEFEPGFSSGEKNPEHHFSGDGTFPVRLTVITACGASNTFTREITTPCFCSPPTAFFRTEVASTDPFTIRITDLPNDESIRSWNWSFGDGTSSSEKTPPDHPYTECGEYLITLRVTNDCGATDEYKQLVCCPVYANFTYRMEPLDGTAPVTVYFTDRTSGTPSAWSWFFGDGGFSSFRNPVHTYTKGGNFSATLHATSSCGGNETHSKPIQIGCPPVTAKFEYYIIQEDPLTVRFTDLSIGDDITEWNWYFGDGTSSTEQNPVHIYRIRDDYQVILTIKNSCGSESTNTIYLPIGCLPLNITATAHEGGYINPSGVIQVPCGWNQNFEITPDECHTIKDVIIDGWQSIGPEPFYSFTDVQIDQTIDAYFEIKEYQIASSADPGGVIDPLGITQLDCGTDKTYTITADPCFNISNVIINGTEHLGAQQSPFSYTFTNVTSDQSIHAIFARKTFPITATAGTGGSISPLGITYVPCGFDQTYTITSNDCYNITSVIVDGTPLSGPFNSPFTYTFNNVQEPHTIHAEFTQRSYIITAEAGLGGTITPSGLVKVPCGTNRRFDITPDSGYAILNVLVNGISVGPVSNYTFTNVRTNQTIQAIFTVKTDCYTISGRITNQLTGAPVAGIRVDAYFQATPQTFQAYATSHPDGYYTIYLPYPPPPAPRTYFVRCPDTVTWVTTNPLSKQINNIEINPGGGAKCDPINIDFQGRPL